MKRAKIQHVEFISYTGRIDCTYQQPPLVGRPSSHTNLRLPATSSMPRSGNADDRCG